MIKVVVEKSTIRIDKITISGHAGYAQHGEDIICAAVSGIVETMRHYFLDRKDLEYLFNERSNEHRFINAGNVYSATMLDYLFSAMVTLEGEYPEYLRVEVVHNGKMYKEDYEEE